TPARQVALVRVVVPRVVELVVHDGETLLIGGGALAEVAVPAARPPGVVGVGRLVGPARRPGARIGADRRRASAIRVGTRLEIAGAGLEAHHAIEVRADPLALAEAGFHDVGLDAAVLH